VQAFPLIFRFSVVVVNERFRAHVRGTGHALAAYEDGQWWCSGVEPGGLTEPGTSPVDAYLGFRKTLGEIFEQIADDSHTVEDYARRVGQFFLHADSHDRQRWQDALESLHRRESSLTEDVAKLPRQAAATRPQVEIEGANAFSEQPETLSLADPEPLSKAA